MDFSILQNDYILNWSLLYGPAISEEMFNFRKKLWSAHKKEYALVDKDKGDLFKDYKNFIPDDDTIYNLLFESELFVKAKKETEKYRLEFLKVYDENKKEINKNIKEIIRFDISDKYNLFLVNPKSEMISIDKNSHNMIVGNTKNNKDTLINIINGIVKKEVANYNNEYKEIVDAIIELAVINEFKTRMIKVSTYEEGDPSLRYLKRQIYPYFLMYLGCDREDFTRYMMRDRIAFEIDKYTIERHLKKVDLFGFIDFCIKNQRYIIRINNIEII